MIEKNLAIVEYRKCNPYLNMNEIAQHFSLTRERIRQILKAEGARTTSLNYGRSKFCLLCGIYKISYATYCPECFHRLHWINLECEECGKIFERLRGLHKHLFEKGNYSHVFCSRTCFYAWFGRRRNWGKLRHTKSSDMGYFNPNPLLPTIDDINWLAEIIENSIYSPERNLSTMELTV